MMQNSEVRAPNRKDEESGGVREADIVVSRNAIPSSFSFAYDLNDYVTYACLAFELLPHSGTLFESVVENIYDVEEKSGDTPFDKETFHRALNRCLIWKMNQTKQSTEESNEKTTETFCSMFGKLFCDKFSGGSFFEMENRAQQHLWGHSAETFFQDHGVNTIEFLEVVSRIFPRTFEHVSQKANEKVKACMSDLCFC